jgi:hypothetical protein
MFENKKVGTARDLLTPEAQAQVNQSMSAAVQEATASAVPDATAAAVAEAVKSVFAQLAPFLKDLQLTPEKLNELKKPFEDPLVLARNAREARQTRMQDAENRKNNELMRANCPHLDQNKRDSISIIHNYPDRQVRGVCHICMDVIEPRRWVIDAPDPATGETKARIADAHKDYQRVLLLAAQSGN